MVNEFNKIVGDMLATEGAVHLPDVGSLVVVRRAAERISSRRLRRSCNAVLLTDRARGRSVVDAVAEICGTDTAGAREIYDRWMSKSVADGMLAIDGVGHIDRGRFFIDEAFDRRLNPNGHSVVELRRQGGGKALKWSIAVAVLLLAAGYAVYWSGVYERCGETASEIASWFAPKERPAKESAAAEHSNAEPEQGEPESEPESETEPQPEQSVHTDAIAEVQSDPEPISGQEPEPDPEPISKSVPEPQHEEAVAAEPKQVRTERQLTPAVPSEGIVRLTSGWSYVVYGVFSAPENAARAVKDMRAKGVESCSAFIYGPKYMVALYFSADVAECNAYIRDAKEFQNLWVYTAH